VEVGDVRGDGSVAEVEAHLVRQRTLEVLVPVSDVVGPAVVAGAPHGRSTVATVDQHGTAGVPGGEVALEGVLVEAGDCGRAVEIGEMCLVDHDPVGQSAGRAPNAIDRCGRVGGPLLETEPGEIDDDARETVVYKPRQLGRSGSRLGPPTPSTPRSRARSAWSPSASRTSTE
jgi:hypothetical protein